MSTAQDEKAEISTPASGGTGGSKRRLSIAGKRRSRRVCQHCHTRKLKCNLQDSGVPCSNCAIYGVTCVLRRRKNQSDRADAALEEIPQNGTGQPASNGAAFATSATQMDEQKHTPVYQSPAQDVVQHLPAVPSPQFPPGMWMDHDLVSATGLTFDSSNTMDAIYEFEHLQAIEDLFAYTAGPSDLTVPLAKSYQPQQATTVPFVSTVGSTMGMHDVMDFSASVTGLLPADHEYLRGQGCFQLPSSEMFRQIMLVYFRFVHPGLPIIAEDQFWGLWTANGFNPGSFSLLVLKAMLFVASSFLDTDMLASLGFSNKRIGVEACYRSAKLLFIFNVEPDPIANAQACLMLTFMSPADNSGRVNSTWLSHAIRCARIAKAHVYYKFLEDDPGKSRMLKRLWWAAIFRDGVLSLALRRSSQIEFDPTWEDDQHNLLPKHVLSADDYSTELGQSPVHGLDTQLRLIELAKSFCRLMHCLARPLKLLYHHEGLEERLNAASRSLAKTVADIHLSLEALQRWHDASLNIFPFPVSLDDSPDADFICIYANMMFCFHATITFSLNTYILLIHTMMPASRTYLDEDVMDTCEEALERTNNDIARRVQELVQVRLINFLPISANPIIGPPLILQAINVVAARGSRLEPAECRKFDVFTRTLQSLQARFNGSDFLSELLSNIIAYAREDEPLIASMTDWKKNHDMTYAPATTGTNRIKAGWNNLVHQRPRLFLRLMVHLDYALCTGGPPTERDFPPELRRTTSG